MEKILLGMQIAAQATTILAAIVVGLWAIYSTIYVKKEKEVTEYNLKDLRQKTAQIPHIQAKVESIVQPTENDLNLLQIKVILFNLGNKPSRVSLDENTLTLIPVTFTEGKPIFQKPINLLSGRYMGTLSRVPLQFVDIGAGESYEFTFVHSLKDPGTYLIHFLALNSTDPSKKDLSLTGNIPYQYAVGADQYIVIK